MSLADEIAELRARLRIAERMADAEHQQLKKSAAIAAAPPKPPKKHFKRRRKDEIPLIYTLDIETDPFLFGRRPSPFQIGFFDGEKFTQFWGDDCIERMFEFLQDVPVGIIYAHNGGRFDVLGYLMDWILGQPVKVINSRIVKSMMECGHEIRDSYTLMPFKLSDYKGKTQKKSIPIHYLENYEIWEIQTRRVTTCRLLFQDVITEYLDYDCRSLFELVMGFIDRYGLELTIGTTAMKQLQKIHEFETLGGKDDGSIRAWYFSGGRVDCLQTGLLKGSFKLYDVNSMYPYVMASYQHPIGSSCDIGRDIGEDTFFLTVTGYNKRAFALRSKDGTDYTCTYGKFHVSIHEYNVAIKMGLFRTEKIHHTFNFDKTSNFAEFVNSFYERRKEAKESGDELEAIFLKYILNSAYGKFAQSPDNYKDYEITRENRGPEGFALDCLVDMNGEIKNKFYVWSKPSSNFTRYNVATGASITGAARSVLMEALALAKNPIYCDTDSILCDDLPLEKDASKLGAWKLEAEVDMAAIAGKKLYALFNNRKLVKKAHKGLMVTGKQIVQVCQGKEVVSYNDAPTFKLDGGTHFISRNVRMTV